MPMNTSLFVCKGFFGSDKSETRRFSTRDCTMRISRCTILQISLTLAPCQCRERDSRSLPLLYRSFGQYMCPLLSRDKISAKSYECHDVLHAAPAGKRSGIDRGREGRKGSWTYKIGFWIRELLEDRGPGCVYGHGDLYTTGLHRGSRSTLPVGRECQKVVFWWAKNPTCLQFSKIRK